MATLNGAQLKKLIKEAVKEVLADNDFVKMIVSEAVKTAIITVLTESNRQASAPTSLQQRVTENRKAPPVKVDNSAFGSDLASGILGNINVQGKVKSQVPSSTTTMVEDGLFTDPTLSRLRMSKSVTNIEASDVQMEDEDWLVSSLGLK